MKKILFVSFLTLVVLASCTGAQDADETVDVPQEIDGKGAGSITILKHTDSYNPGSYEMTLYGQDDTVYFNEIDEIRSEEKNNEDGSTDFTLYYNDKLIGELSTPGEGAINVVHGPNFKNADGTTYSQPYIYLHLRPSGIGGYILGPVHGDFYRINMATNTLEALDFALDAVYAGELDPNNVGTVIHKGASIGFNKNDFTLSITDLDDLTTQDYVYTKKDFSQAGAPKFSADGKTVTFKIFKGDPDNEFSTDVSFDMESGTFTIEG